MIKIENKEDLEWKDLPNYEGLYKVSNYGELYSYRFDKILQGSIHKDGYRLYNIFDKEGNPHIMSGHRAVALTFIPNPNNFPIINHKNEQKEDNYYLNLEWCTSLYNNHYNGINEKIARKIIEEYGKECYAYDENCEEYYFESHRACARFLHTSSGGFASSFKNSLTLKRPYYYKGYIIFNQPLSIEQINYFFKKYSSLLKWENGKSKKVGQYSLDGELLNIFPSVNKACKFLNKKSACTISSCCLGKYKTAYGFKWKYLD